MPQEWFMCFASCCGFSWPGNDWFLDVFQGCFTWLSAKETLKDMGKYNQSLHNKLTICHKNEHSHSVCILCIFKSNVLSTVIWITLSLSGSLQFMIRARTRIVTGHEHSFSSLSVGPVIMKIWSRLFVTMVVSTTSANTGHVADCRMRASVYVKKSSWGLFRAI